MRKHIILLASLLGIGNLYAQNIQDAVRYSQNGIYGNARYTALSGAFSPLGGNLSAINDNPAASAVFLENQMDFSLLIAGNNSKSNFQGNVFDKNYTDVQLSNAGIVMVYNLWDESSIWNKISLGVNYKLDNSYGDNMLTGGLNNHSVSNYFVEVANGVNLELLQLQREETISSLYRYLGRTYGSNAQTAFLGYQAYLIDPLDPDNPKNNQYASNVSGNQFDQRKDAFERGYQSTIAFNLGTQLLDNLYLGINLNAHLLDYERRDVFREKVLDETSYISFIHFEENLRAFGTGFSGQIGAIYKLENGLRLGFTYTTPKWTRIEEETMQYLEVDHYPKGNLTTEIISPNVVNVYEKYTLRTPGKVGASIAYVIGTHGLISLQYDYTNYANTRYKPRNHTYFANQNDIMKTALGESNSLRLGGEYNIGLLSLRGGLHYQESPYKDSDIMGDTKGFSLGFGLRFSGIDLDFAYLNSSQDTSSLLLSTDMNSYNLDKTQHNFVASLGFKF